VVNSFAMSVLAALALRLKMDAEETSVVRLDRYAEQQAFEGRSARARRVAVHFSTEVRAVLAHTKVPMRSTRSYSGQHMVATAIARIVKRRRALLPVRRLPTAMEEAPCPSHRPCKDTWIRTSRTR
jgi:hypothetical protein